MYDILLEAAVGETQRTLSERGTRSPHAPPYIQGTLDSNKVQAPTPEATTPNHARGQQTINMERPVDAAGHFQLTPQRSPESSYFRLFSELCFDPEDVFTLGFLERGFPSMSTN